MPELPCLRASHCDGRSPRARAGSLRIEGERVAWEGKARRFRCDVARVVVSPRVGRAQRFIALPDGTQLCAEDHPALDQLPQEVRSEGPVAWLEARTAVAFGAVALVLAFVVWVHVAGRAALAEAVVRGLPLAAERTIGEGLLTELDAPPGAFREAARGLVEPTQLDEEELEAIRRRLDKLAAHSPMQPWLRVEHRASATLGANAFALPGGIILVTDDLVEVCGVDGVAGVLAHEIAHVEARHALVEAAADSLMSMLVSTVTADGSSLATTASGVPALLSGRVYSREIEAAADERAFTLLRAARWEPELLTDCLDAVERDEGGTATEAWGLTSTHPLTSERVEQARRAAGVPAPAPSSGAEPDGAPDGGASAPP